MRPDVLLVVPQLQPVFGMERAALAVVDALAQETSVSVCALSGDLPPDVPGVALHLGRGAARLARSRAGVRRVVTALRPRVVVVSGLWAALPVLSQRLDVPVVVWEHSLLPSRVAAEPRLRVLSRLAAVSYGRASAVVAVSHAVARHLEGNVRGLHGRDVTVIPNVAVDAGSAASRPRPGGGDELSLLAVGALRPVKNQALAVRALQHLPATTTLTICGEGPERASLEALARDLGVHDRVVLPGYVDDPFRRYGASTDVFVHPSTAETFGMAVIEAAAAGLPSVVLAQPALDEAVPRYAPGVLVPDADARQFARAVTAAADVGAEDFDAAARRREQDLSPRGVAAAWLRVLEGVTA